MFPSFTGSARPRRQVNLSGRNSNPFAALPGSRTPSNAQTTQNALAQAQQERILRQQERERPPAATRIQKTWRGHKGRRDARIHWRQEWDTREAWGRRVSLDTPYVSEAECLDQLRLLVQFVSPRIEDDISRLHHFAHRYLLSTQTLPSACQADIWIYPLLRLAKTIMATMRTKRRLSRDVVNDFLKLLRTLASAIPRQLSSYSYDYYGALAEVALGLWLHVKASTIDPKLLDAAVLALIQPPTPRTSYAYEGFAHEFLITPNLPTVLGSFDALASGLDYESLATALDGLLSPQSHQNLFQVRSRDELLWLLAYFVCFRREAYGKQDRKSGGPDVQYVKIISRLVSFLADDIGTRIDVFEEPRKSAKLLPVDELDKPRRRDDDRLIEPLPSFIRSEILTLVNQDNVSGLLANMETKIPRSDSITETSKEASFLASYALTLLRAFPKKGDEIRMWLYLGSTSRHSDRLSQQGPRLPAIKYFYQAASRTKIYERIRKDPQEAVSMLRPDKAQIPSKVPVQLEETEARDQQWRVILIFLELYTFVLKVMDDEEFLSGSLTSTVNQTWTRQSALPLDQVKDLTLFLKNLAFSMYWNVSDIAGIEATEAKKTSLAEYFGGSGVTQEDDREDPVSVKVEEMAVAGVSGMTLAYVKGMVTGLLRMVYERDSRRKFLPSDHWLMTKYFEMDRFIPSVVSEEEHKHQIQESYEADPNSQDIEVDEDEEDSVRDYNLIGTQRAQQVRNLERLKRQQRKTSRRKFLQSVTPRLEILQNMPFFIPFATRVQIFREFVVLDQMRRRGTVDPDEWRYVMMNSGMENLSKHRAKVRRESIFDDAYARFYDLGEGLKEPIQISFVDKFDTVEEGIDGGGVTKEFLTSVTTEAFGAINGLEALFIENDQHLLYPNPSLVEERKASLQAALIREGTVEWNENIRDLLRRYEFLGRIIGKCLYEGILVDIHFAPFFLLKWALTGGSGSATKESGYRANLNDLRDLDEGLYQGLLQLKNYPGDVEDFSLNFAVTDTIRTSHTETKSITRELCSKGATTSVTNQNRLVYISYITRHRLQAQPALQTSAFLRGLGTIISLSWLSMFNQSELQTLVGGASSEISVSDLRANTQYGGVYAIGDDGLEHSSVQMFWKVMQSMDDTDRKKVLKFVTSTPRAPLLGFGNLNPRFSIRDSGSDQTRLPTTSTCVNLLKLPVYRDEKVLRERLLYSVNSGAGFNLS